MTYMINHGNAAPARLDACDIKSEYITMLTAVDISGYLISGQLKHLCLMKMHSSERDSADPQGKWIITREQVTMSVINKSSATCVNHQLCELVNHRGSFFF